MHALLIGNVTIDYNKTEKGTYTGVGGSVFFAGKILSNLGVDTTIAAPIGADFPAKELHWAHLLNLSPKSPHTLIFHNEIGENGNRTQRVENDTSAFMQFSNFKALKVQSEIIIIAPLLQTISNENIKKIRIQFPEAQITLLPQGLYRSVKEQGNIKMQDWNYSVEAVRVTDCIILSREDLKDADTQAHTWSTLGPIVIVTKDTQGCSAYEKGVRRDVSAFEITYIVDSTGCGDIFAAAFAFAYHKTGNLPKSSLFANAAAAYSLLYLPNQLQYDYQHIVSFARGQGRNVAL